MASSKIVHTPEMRLASKRDKNRVAIIREEIKVPEKLKLIAKNRKYLIRTYGCQANVRDEETMSGLLELAGFSKTDDVKEADIVILNTCAVRENAEDKVFGEIGNLKHLKEKNKSMIVAVSGCMIQQTHIVEAIDKTYRHVDLMFGTHNIHMLLDLLDEVYSNKIRIIDVESKMGEVIENLPVSRLDAIKAYVNIMYGCDKFCTYCIVPYTRGKERSREFNDIIAECETLVKAGYQEINLLGQNVNAYGKDLGSEEDFACLLEKVASLGIPRLRFTTSHPWDFTDKMIEVIARYENIMPAIHLPVQSGNDEILRKMGRRYTSDDYKTLVDKLKKHIPHVALSTDIIVGFPNETYEQFLDTLKMVEYVQYDFAFTFIYSPRVGTPAAKMVDDVSDEEKHKRFDELLLVVDKYIGEKSDATVGKVFKVLVDGASKKNKNVLSGYTESNKIVHFTGGEELIGKIVQVRILSSHLYSLKGELI